MVEIHNLNKLSKATINGNGQTLLNQENLVPHCLRPALCFHTYRQTYQQQLIFIS